MGQPGGNAGAVRRPGRGEAGLGRDAVHGLPFAGGVCRVAEPVGQCLHEDWEGVQVFV